MLKEIEKKFLCNKIQLKINEVLISQKLDELSIGSSNSIRSCSLKGSMSTIGESSEN